MMEKISRAFALEHKRCDDLFSTIETQVKGRDWNKAQVSFTDFSQEMERHFHKEEDVLFPALEKRAKESTGPTRVMRSEHQDIRQLLEELRKDLLAQNAEHFLGLAETLLIMIQQHNYKEENILYRMADSVLAGEQTDILARVGFDR